jgi:hypothetical protein
MTAARECRRCGAHLPPNGPWCTQCLEPVRHLSPRDPQLPPRTDLELIDPATIRRDYAPIRLEEPTYSRVRPGTTAFGLWGRLALTAVVLFWLPWGIFTPKTLFYLIAYLPIAALLLAGIWRRDLVGPASTVGMVFRIGTIQGIRVMSASIGAVLFAVALASRAALPGYLPALSFVAVAAFPAAAVGVAEAIAEARAHPLGALVALNALNLLDLILSDAAIGAGVARELNPLVVAVGPWAKLILVAICSGLIYWKRPQVLVWPCLAFLVLAAYHLTGLLGGIGGFAFAY